MEQYMNLFDRFTRWMINSGKSPKTTVSWRSGANSARKLIMREYNIDIFNEQSVGKCKPSMMDEWFNTVIIHMSQESQHSYILAVQKYFEYLVKFKVITADQNPTEALPKVGHPQVAPDIAPEKIYSPEEIKAMLTKPYPYHDEIQDAKFKAIITTLLESGLRAFELCSITVGQMRNCKNNTLNILRKGGKVKPVIIGDAAWPYIKKYYELARKNANDNEKFFVSARNAEYDHGGLYCFITARQEYIGIAHPGVHNFRHTAISNVAQSGNIVAARDFAGHSSVTMTNRYMHTKEEARQNIVNDTPMSRIMNEISGNHPTAVVETPRPQIKIDEEKKWSELTMEERIALLRSVFPDAYKDDDDEKFPTADDLPDWDEDDFEI